MKNYVFLWFLLLNMMNLLVLIKSPLNEENKFIEEMIKIEDKYPYVYINVGEKENVPLYISLYTPHILLFPKDNNPIRYDYTTSKTYVDKNITTEMSHPQNPKTKIKIRISSETFKYENNNYNFTFSIIDGQKKAGPDNVGGVYGILRDVDKFENITKDVLLLEQLYKKNLINKKIFYISNFFDGDNSLNQAKLLIGKIPEEFDGENKKKLPFCSFDDTFSKNYYDCKLGGFIFEETNNNISYSIKIDERKTIIGRFEEGNIQQHQMPLSLFPEFKKYFIDKKGCKLTENKDSIICEEESTRNIKISFVFNGYKFILNKESTWHGKEINFVFNQEQDTIILLSAFLGNYHRIYDLEDKKMYFSSVQNNIIKINNNSSDNGKKPDDNNTKTIWIIVGSIGGVIVIGVILFVIITVTKKKNKSYIDEVQKVSFINDEDRENNEKIIS